METPLFISVQEWKDFLKRPKKHWQTKRSNSLTSQTELMIYLSAKTMNKIEITFIAIKFLIFDTILAVRIIKLKSYRKNFPSGRRNSKKHTKLIERHSKIM